MQASTWSAVSKTTLCVMLMLAMTSHHVARAGIADYDEEDDVIILNANNFDKALGEFKYLFIDFYAPWCSHCKALAPEFSRLSQLLEEENSEIVIAKVDATAEKELAERYKVTGFPTLKLFRKGEEKPLECKTPHRAGEMYVWLKKKLSSPVDKLDTVEAAKKLVDESIVFVLGFFKDRSSAAAKAYIEVADNVDDISFGITDAQELFKEFEITTDEAVVLFKKFDEGRVDLKGKDLETVDNIKNLVEYHRMPLVIEFNEETAPKIFKRALRTHLIMFVSKTSSSFDKRVAEFRQVAQPYRGKLLFVYVDIDPEEYKRVLDFFGLKRSSCPTYRLIDLEGNFKYKPDTDEADVAELTQFIEQVLSGKRAPHLMSEPISKDWDSKPVKELVGLNFNEVAKDKTKDVIVEFYAPWCGHCKELAPVWEELGAKYKNSDRVVVAKMDVTANEVEGVKVTYFPTIRLYPKDSEEVFEFPGGSSKTLDRLVQFVESGGQAPEEKKSESSGEKSSDEGKKDEL